MSVIDLDAARERRAKTSGEAFELTRRDDLGAADAPVGHAQGFVVVLLDARAGLALSPAAARALAQHLIEAAASAAEQPVQESLR